MYFFFFLQHIRNGSNYGYYHGNTTGNYSGSYNHAFTASPSQNGVQNPNVQPVPPNVLPKPTYDNFNPTLPHVNEGQSLNIDKSAVQPPHSTSGYSNTNRYVQIKS